MRKGNVTALHHLYTKSVCGTGVGPGTITSTTLGAELAAGKALLLVGFSISCATTGGNPPSFAIQDAAGAANVLCGRLAAAVGASVSFNPNQPILMANGLQLVVVGAATTVDYAIQYRAGGTEV